MPDLDLEHLAPLKARLRRSRGPDFRLGLEIVAAVEPESEEGRAAREYLDAASAETCPDGSSPTLDPAVYDITSSVDAALRMMGRLGLATSWSVFCDDRAGSSGRVDGPYSVHLEHDPYLSIGGGWTLAICLVDGIVRAMAPDLGPDASEGGEREIEAKASEWDSIPHHEEDHLREPCVGIFWGIPHGSLRLAVCAAKAPLSKAEPYGDFLTFPDGHYETWEKWRRRSPGELPVRGIPSVVAWHEYEYFPRGRIVYDRNAGRFTIYADRRLQTPAALADIFETFRLDKAICDIRSDPHYRSGSDYLPD